MAAAEKLAETESGNCVCRVKSHNFLVACEGTCEILCLECAVGAFHCLGEVHLRDELSDFSLDILDSVLGSLVGSLFHLGESSFEILVVVELFADGENH